MEFTKEQIVEIGLSEEQVPKVTELVNNNESTLKKEWDTKATIDAENILHGATQSIVELTGIQHEKGQKVKDYLQTASENFLKGQKADLDRKIIELDGKIKAGGGDETLKTELQETKDKLDLLQQKEAKFKDWEENDYKGKYEEATKTLSDYKVNQAFLEVKPKFPDTVNEYESKGRWNEFKSNVLEKYNIEKNDNDEFVAVDKENKYTIIKLKDLVTQNKEISELAKGRQFTGLGADVKKEIELEGVPFKVKEDATPQERQKAIEDYLTGELKLPKISSEYAKRFEFFIDNGSLGKRWSQCPADAAF